MKTTQLTQASVSNFFVLSFALVAATAAVSLAFHQPVSASNKARLSEEVAVQQVVIVGKRMTAAEKLAYDLVPEEVARVEIIGHRFSAEEKLAMMTAEHTAIQSTHRKG